MSCKSQQHMLLQCAARNGSAARLAAHGGLPIHSAASNPRTGAGTVPVPAAAPFTTPILGFFVCRFWHLKRKKPSTLSRSHTDTQTYLHARFLQVVQRQRQHQPYLLSHIVICHYQTSTASPRRTFEVIFLSLVCIDILPKVTGDNQVTKRPPRSAAGALISSVLALLPPSINTRVNRCDGRNPRESPVLSLSMCLSRSLHT